MTRPHGILVGVIFVLILVLIFFELPAGRPMVVGDEDRDEDRDEDWRYICRFGLPLRVRALRIGVKLSRLSCRPVQ